MKKFSAFLVTLFLLTSVFSIACAKTKPTPPPSTPVTLERFLLRYEEGLSEAYAMFAQKKESFTPAFSTTDDGEILFSFESSGCAIRGNAYSDTTVIRSANILMTKADAAAFAAIALMYAFNADENVWGSDSQSIGNINKKPVTINGYKISMVDSNVAGWSKTLIFEKTDGNVSMDAIGEVKYPDALMAASTSDGVSLSVGEYDVGTHIPAGEYKVTPIKSANIFVYRNGDLKTNEYLDIGEMDEIGRLVLQDGDRIEISGGKLQFTPFQ